MKNLKWLKKNKTNYLVKLGSNRIIAIVRLEEHSDALVSSVGILDEDRKHLFTDELSAMIWIEDHIWSEHHFNADSVEDLVENPVERPNTVAPHCEPGTAKDAGEKS